jgi:hypothetical protein
MTQPSLYKQDGKLRTDDPIALTNWLREELGYAFVEASKVVAARLDAGGETITVYISGIVVCRADLAAMLMRLIDDPALLPTASQWVRKEVGPRKRTRLPHAARTNAISVEVYGSKRYLTGADGQLTPLAQATIEAVRQGTHDFRSLCEKLASEEGISIATARLMLRMLLKAGIIRREFRGWYELA